MLLLNGNCLELLGTVPTNTVDLVICDLPYGQTDCEWDIKIDLVSLWTELKRVAKPNTAFFFFCTTKFGYELIRSNEKWFRYDLVWYKPNCSAGFLHSRQMPMRNHEMLYVFYDRLPFYNFQEHHQQIQTNKTPSTKKTANGTVYTTKLNQVTGKQWEPPLPRSHLEYPITNKSKKALHSTQKPVELLKWIIKYYSKAGDVVLDPTMGSGSTGVAAKELGRDFIGIELDANFFAIAQQRLQEDTAEDEPDDSAN